MQNLEWHNIEVSEEIGIVIKTIRQKTNKPYNANIGKQAYEIIGQPMHPNDKVFPGLNNRDRYEFFQLWLTKAGIVKKLTFHDLRHTYGTLQIDAGTDIYVLKGNMAHSNVRFTQQYAHQSDKRKREAAERIKLDIF
jgi:integrase